MVSTRKAQNSEQSRAWRVALGNRLGDMRRALNWTQAQAAERAGLSQSALSAYEAGRAAIPFESAVALAAAYRVEVGRLVE